MDDDLIITGEHFIGRYSRYDDPDVIVRLGVNGKVQKERIAFATAKTDEATTFIKTQETSDRYVDVMFDANSRIVEAPPTPVPGLLLDSLTEDDVAALDALLSSCQHV